MNYKVIITGSTGMVGKAVLLECLESELISEVLLVNRSSLQLEHPKLKEVLLPDFMHFEHIKEELKGYDACFHCMGVSASGLSDKEYMELTFGITKSLANTLYDINPNMQFNYVSGSGTDSSEKGSSMWARVKGKTENYILNKGFAKSLMFRAGIIIPEKGLKSKTSLYNTIYTLTKPFYGLLKMSENITTTTKLGLAMINSLSKDLNVAHIENKGINLLAKQNA